MGNLSEAVQIEVMASQAQPDGPTGVRTAEQIADSVFAEAERRGRPFTHWTPPTWRKHWLASRRFHLMRIPLAAAALTCKPKDPGWMLSRIYAESGQDSVRRPIVVDLNKRGVGRAPNSGFTPPVVVIDGKHRFNAAALRGSSHIWAWVGEMAAEHMSRVKRPKVREGMFHGPLRRPATRLDTVAELHGDGNAQHVEDIDAVLARELGTDPTVIRRLVAQFTATGGRYKVGGPIRAVSPPGWSNSVERMKQHKGITNPFALAWFLHDQGYHPHGKK